MSEPRSLEELDLPERDLLAYTDVLEQHRTRTGAFAKFALDQPHLTHTLGEAAAARERYQAEALAHDRIVDDVTAAIELDEEST